VCGAWCLLFGEMGCTHQTPDTPKHQTPHPGTGAAGRARWAATALMPRLNAVSIISDVDGSGAVHAVLPREDFGGHVPPGAPYMHFRPDPFQTPNTNRTTAPQPRCCWQSELGCDGAMPYQSFPDTLEVRRPHVCTSLVRHDGSLGEFLN